MYGHEFLLVFDDRLRPILFQNYFSGRDPLFYIAIKVLNGHQFLY